MTKNIEDIIRVFAKRIYDIQFVDLPDATRNSAVDRDARIMSDFIGCEKEKVTHNTYFILKNCKMWSEEAIAMYNTFSGPHADRCHRGKSGHEFTIEHEYPLGIVKKMVQDKQFESVEHVIKYMKKYAVPVIVTLEEDAKLRTTCRTADSLDEAKDRYKKVGIKVQRFTDWA
jgi:hypothetical protein